MMEFKTKRCLSYKRYPKCLRHRRNAVFEVEIVKYELSRSIVGEAVSYLSQRKDHHWFLHEYLTIE